MKGQFRYFYAAKDFVFVKYTFLNFCYGVIDDGVK